MTMTKGERDDLSRLIRQRERVMKAAATQRAAELLADFEREMGAIHHYNNDETWARLHAEAKAMVAEAQTKVEARCKEMGIPAEFAPRMELYWYGRGENALKDRQQELRRMAKQRIKAMEAGARTAIEVNSVEAQTKLLAGSLTSEAAQAFLADMPKIETLMPKIDTAGVVELMGAAEKSLPALDGRVSDDD
jgi:hypothetical protein